MKTRWNSFVAVVACNAAMGLVPACAGLLFGGFGWRRFRDWSISGLVYANLIGSVCWILAPRLGRVLCERPRWVRLAAMCGLFAAAGIAGAVLGSLILGIFGLSSGVAFAIRISLAITFTFGLLIFAIFTLSESLGAAREELHRRQIEEERARKMAAEARYASLESRVQPHFLFNTLNSISALVRENPAEAERMIERFSALLRYSLDTEIAGLVRLSEELRIVRSYLEIERVRFGERLRCRFDIEEAAQNFLVPPLSVQTLVENSVKYAVGASREGATIAISAHVSNGAGLRIEVSDDGPGFEPSASLKPGHGLDLLRNRLSSLFGPAASLEVAARDGLTLVAISLAA